MEAFFHSVRLDEEKCEGCTNCIKRCPTEAIRVRNGKAHIISERCIDCGECIRICPHHAKYAECDSFNKILDYKYRVALPAPTLYGQFNNLDDVDYVLTALKSMGFDDAFEVSRGAELVSDATRLLMESGKLKKPVISSACPAVCRLIRVRFPKLIDHLLDLNSPMEEAARLARIEAVEKKGLDPSEIGIFFLTPCPAKNTAVKQPLGLEKSNVDGVVAIKNVYPVLFQQMDKVREPESMKQSGVIGVSWAGSGGESAALLRDQYLAADGTENVIKVLEELEDEKLNDIDFIELNACTGGCVGGVLTVENPFVARARLQRLRRYLPVSCNHLENDEIPKAMHWERPLEASSVLKLADNVIDAMKRMNELNELHERLPGLDCGTCGAPSCRALAEDIVRGLASEQDCVFFMSKRAKSTEFENYIPAPFRKKEAGAADRDTGAKE
ncbi:MAG: [Fe-Fe] hydrogenase large subunit C-terminal domain-containing protein [Candidatus Fimivicinus sp.]|nr:4Fe-4S binding protein [Oscillospiraceae bacterium]MDY5591435.1 [Fe-Fe] hydrogenase large subunit C-terminal domain-containing protein [Candidatus Fimivicinus sp.]